jgi:hypothetical protein
MARPELRAADIHHLRDRRNESGHVSARCQCSDLLGRRVALLGTALNFAAALAGLIAAWRWYQTTTIRPPTELPFGGPTDIDTGRLLRSLRRSRG